MNKDLARIRSRFEGLDDEEIMVELDRRLAKAHKDRNDLLTMMREKQSKIDRYTRNMYMIGGHLKLANTTLDNFLEEEKENGTDL